MMMYRDKTFIASKTGFDIIEDSLVEVECTVPRVFTTWNYFAGKEILRMGALGPVSFQQAIYDLFGSDNDIFDATDESWLKKLPSIPNIPGTSHIGFLVLEQEEDSWLFSIIREPATSQYSFMAQKWVPGSVVHDCVVDTPAGSCATFTLSDPYGLIAVEATAQLVYLKTYGLKTNPNLIVWKPSEVDEIGVHHHEFKNYDIHKLLAYDQYLDLKTKPKFVLLC